ncbi:MAG: FadR/GntR family transcriptional regulator [Albidovulum sp.]|nr:FadR/GntR family transcriptional regulator [Albidovulum sp.]MDE0533016.1 FadR/GntR family transcriptional regulator [Albidovulum sp.]
MNELLYYDLKDTTGVSPSLATQVCRELGRRIVGGHLPEHAQIDDESKLAEKFGVSKPVIREAVKLLVGKGLLEVRRGSGTRVRHRGSWALLDDDVLAWHLSVDPKPDFLRQLMDIRRMMEPKAAGWAADFGLDQQHRTISEAQSRMEQDALSVEDFVVADAQFHRAILRAANNEILRSMEGVIFSALLSSIRLTNSDPRENKSSIPFHREVLEAILKRDAATAEEKMSRHLDDTSERLIAAVEGFATPARMRAER